MGVGCGCPVSPVANKCPHGCLERYDWGMSFGYARVSTAAQDLTVQVEALKRLGVDEERIYVDQGFTGANGARPGLEKALAVRAGDELVVTKLDWLARSIRDAKDIADELASEGVTLRLGLSAYDPTGPMGKMVLSMLVAFAEFEADLIQMRTREGMQVAKSKDRPRGKKPKLSGVQEKHSVDLYRSGEHTTAELFGVARSTVFRAVERAGGAES